MLSEVGISLLLEQKTYRSQVGTTGKGKAPHMVQGIEHRPQKLSLENGPCILQSSPELCLVMNLLPGPALGSEKVLRD